MTRIENVVSSYEWTLSRHKRARESLYSLFVACFVITRFLLYHGPVLDPEKHFNEKEMNFLLLLLPFHSKKEDKNGKHRG